jgi:hypothetical protein
MPLLPKTVNAKDIMHRFPEFELSYETISHKKVSPQYNIGLAIPSGKKAFAWFTYMGIEDLCFIFDLNKEKKILNSYNIQIEFNRRLSSGTLLYGTYFIDTINNREWFIIEDIFYYRDVPLRNTVFSEKLLFLERCMNETDRQHSKTNQVVFVMPAIWKIDPKTENAESATTPPDIGYPVHHIQYRASVEIMPYINVYINKKQVVCNTSLSSPPCVVVQPTFHMDFSKPQYKYPTVFHVSADIQYDIYHLFAYGKNKQFVYYNTAYVPNYKSSIYLNGLFRNIRENKNLDYIEESDDEEDFQNIREDKYVNVEKILLMECEFHSRFKKWIPKRVVDKYTKVVHINSLVKDYTF